MSEIETIDALISEATADGLFDLASWLTENRDRLIAKCAQIASQTAQERENLAKDQRRSLFVYRLD